MWLGKKGRRKGRERKGDGEVREGNWDRENLELPDWGMVRSGNMRRRLGGERREEESTREGGSVGCGHGESECIE